MRFLRRPVLIAAALATVSSVAAFAQAPPSNSTSDGLELLTQVAKKYAEAKSYYIESVEEGTTSNEYSYDWQKTVLTAAESSGNRFYYEGRSMAGSSVRVSDGKNIWIYRVNDHRYTAKPVSAAESNEHMPIAMPEYAMMQAERLRKSLGDMAKSLKSAQRLPDANLKVNGHKVSCAVVHVQTSDQKRVPPNYSFEKTIWIDKNHETVLRIVEHEHTHTTVGGGSEVPIEVETSTNFTNADLDGPVRDSLFTFTPPADARLVENFPDPRHFGPDMTGEQVPALKLKSADGKAVSLDSFRGKPVLIDFWATWCSPCVTALPKLDKIYQEAKDKGLVMIFVDQDEEAKTATDFLAKKGYTWPNFHDEGDVEKLMGSSGVPREVLIDTAGKIVYDGGSDENELRSAIAKLGPEYASLQPKPKETSCPAVN